MNVVIAVLDPVPRIARACLPGLVPVVGIVGRWILSSRQCGAIGSGKRSEVVVERVILFHDDDDVIDLTSEIGLDAHDDPRLTSRWYCSLANDLSGRDRHRLHKEIAKNKKNLTGRISQSLR